MLDLNRKHTYQFADLLQQLELFNEKRYQNITAALAKAISNANTEHEKDSFIALLQVASAAWIASEAISEASTQVNKKAEE